jgi:hypothetical protein
MGAQKMMGFPHRQLGDTIFPASSPLLAQNHSRPGTPWQSISRPKRRQLSDTGCAPAVLRSIPLTWSTLADQRGHVRTNPTVLGVVACGGKTRLGMGWGAGPANEAPIGPYPAGFSGLAQQRAFDGRRAAFSRTSQPRQVTCHLLSVIWVPPDEVTSGHRVHVGLGCRHPPKSMTMTGQCVVVDVSATATARVSAVM